MHSHRYAATALGVAALAFTLILPARAQTGVFTTAKDIGDPGAAGSTKVDDKGVYTLEGSGSDIWNDADQFHYVYRLQKGDGSIIARVLGTDGGDAAWHKTGPMMRNSDSAGSQHVFFAMTSGNGVVFQGRTEPDSASYHDGTVAPRQFPTLMRLQRAGNDFSGFVSNDGKVWRAVTPTRTLAMGEEILWGLAVTSHSDGEITTASFDTVSVNPGLISVGGISSCGGDRQVLLQWKPIADAVGYNLYRGAADALTIDHLTKINTAPVTSASFTDNTPGLVNGTPMAYAVQLLTKDASGAIVEGPLTLSSATPVLAPAGFTGCSVNEGANAGSVTLDANGEITIHGSGGDLWGTSDQGYFVLQPVEGDFQITVKALTKPSETNVWSKAGLMIRESLDGGARDAYLVLTGAQGLAFQYRGSTGGDAAWPGSAALDNDTLALPITLRLTRKGNEITPEYSLDDGKTFEAAGDAFTFEQDLPKMLHAGLAITAHDGSKISDAKFSNLEIKKL